MLWSMSSVPSAIARLEAALSRLEGTLETLFESKGTPAQLKRELEAMSQDRENLAHQLDESLGRERELQGLADEASDALGAAILEVRAALARSEDGDEANGQS